MLFGYLLLSVIYLGLTGAIIAAIAGRILMSLVYLYFNRRMISESRFNMQVLRGWLNASWLPLLSSIVGLLISLDVIIVRILSGSEVPIAYYGICMSIMQISLLASAVTSTLYPKVVSKKNLEDFPEAIWLILLLSVPIVFAIFIYAVPFTAMFGIKYLQAASPLQFFTFAIFMQILSGLPGAAYIALESADDSDNIGNKTLLRTAWLKNTILNLLVNSCYLVGLSISATLSLPAETLVSLWAVMTFISYAALFFAYIYLVKRDFGQLFPLGYLTKSLFRFLIPVPLIALPYLIIGVQISETAMVIFMNLMTPGLLSIVLYFLALYAIDPKLRKIIVDILSNLRSRR